LEKINDLLHQVKIISRKNAEILDATGGRFNMFRICGVNHYENTHSAIIAEFLNPKGAHGLKSGLLECFIEILGEHFSIKDFNCKKSRVFTEHTTEVGRIDILIEDNQNKAIIIENKIYAGDQFEQLKRYDRYAQKYKGGYQIVYLTLFGDSASEQSGKGVSYLSISHKENIINWLEKCVSIASRFPIVRETIIQYINHLKQLTNQDMDLKNKEEITEILSKIENLKAAKVIYQNYGATYNFLASRYFNPKMEEFAKEKGLHYHYERSEESHIKFYFTSTDWEGKYWIGFTFEQCNDFKNYKVPDEKRIKLHEHLTTFGIALCKQTDWWLFYFHFSNLSLEVWEDDIINSDNFINDCKEKTNNLLKAIEAAKI
jgi:hypothetical protein